MGYNICPVIREFAYFMGEPDPEDERMRYVKEVTERRAALVADWLTKEYAPTWLRLAGRDDFAAELVSLPEITSIFDSAVTDAVLDRSKNEAPRVKLSTDNSAAVHDAYDIWVRSAGMLLPVSIMKASTGDHPGKIPDPVPSMLWINLGALSKVCIMYIRANSSCEVAPFEPTTHRLREGLVGLYHRLGATT